MITETIAAWRVVETRFDEQGQVTRVIHHTHISGKPMDDLAARELANVEKGRYANARLRRSFRAEPITPPTPGGNR